MAWAKSNSRYQKRKDKQTFTNILAPVLERASLLGEQKTDMDFLSRENSSVSSFLINCFITWRQTERDNNYQERPFTHCRCATLHIAHDTCTVLSSTRSPFISRHTHTLTEQHAVALSTGRRLLRSVSNTFIFSTRQHRAVSVASPTFSYTHLLCSYKFCAWGRERMKWWECYISVIINHHSSYNTHLIRNCLFSTSLFHWVLCFTNID